ncbi:Nrap protein [Gloeophyllum trabeum ATCC 11539]|uniref:U3 small nucleolar RNA-associated protein 22 n=1 Tax=Gloeophyllum trabeum (strain ATCC 11539 / FP-39264 / Madison 617) TaxID=670483 RepID=S7RBK4_GLOTA|nr:Nrap protein [Gloeophyllum trabeum ATCC 11539]EPQ51620.1 Nrap protein [Gloeophyllum trabeum ATCC 11539]
MSSSFKLQIDALLPNVRPKSSRIPPLDRFLFALHSVLTSLSSREAQHPLEAAHKLQDKSISVPYPDPRPTKETNWKVGFEKPYDVNVVGSWANKCSVKGQDGTKFRVDLAVEMPAALFQEKDYLNGRFFHKKAYYLACLADAVVDKQSGLNATVEYRSVSGDPRLTTLLVRSPQGSVSDKSETDFTPLNAEIQIIPTLPNPPPFPLHRLSPTQCNLRLSSESQTPTPLYNTALLLSCTPKAHLLAVHKLKADVPAFADALTLLRVWANQRGYGEGSRLCVRGFEGRGAWWTGVLELLVRGEEGAGGKGGAAVGKRKPVGKGLSSYQMFRAALDFLAKHDFEDEAVVVKTNGGHRYPADEYKSSHDAVFVDSVSLVNLLAGVPLSSLDMLKHDAQLTLDILGNSAAVNDAFNETFLKDQRSVPSRFDAFISVDIASAKLDNISSITVADQGLRVTAILNSLASVLRRGLGNRAKAVAILHPTSTPRSVSESHPSSPHTVCIGIIYNTEHAFRLVEHGPAVDDPDTSFAAFWGDKAELRRFKDGSITQSVVWDVQNSDERARIPVRIVEYLLDRHFSVSTKAVKTWQARFDSILRLPESISSMIQQQGATGGFKNALAAFDGLLRALKSSEELPLSILNVHPVSEYLRYTSVFSPLPVPPELSSVLPKCARYVPVFEVILEFEKSGRWPDDLRAIQKIKLAFFERIAAALMNHGGFRRAVVVLGDGVCTSEIQDQARLEIVTDQGWVFSARIWHDREAILLDRIINDKSHISKAVRKTAEGQSKDRQLALEAREVYLRRFIHAPKHHRAIANMSHRFSAYAGTARLVKRWLSSHWLLHGHISEEVVEIICASVFLGGRQYGDGPSVPGSKERGFARVVEFLKDWKIEEGLFVPLYAAGAGEQASPEEGANHIGVLDKTGAWSVRTEEDPEGRMWTSHGPDSVVALRVKALAKATWNLLQSMESRRLDVKTLFLHPTDDYDFLVKLDASVLPRYHQNISADPKTWSRGSGYANLQPRDEEPSRPGRDPAQLLFDDLQRVYQDSFKVFYDCYGGNTFGAVWDPSVKKRRPFRVMGGFSSIPVKKEEKSKEKGTVTLNESAILSEITRIGAGLVNDVVVQSS